METLLHWDMALFEVINNGWQNPVLDAILPWWRNKYLWAPAYLFLITFLFANFGKKGAVIVLGILLTIAIADTLSSAVLKKKIQRLRPCKTELLAERVHLLIHCGAGYSFPSSHATNHFALALFLIGTLGKRFSRIKLPLLFWATTVAISQVYVGVHFPLDVLGGALLGSLIGLGVSRGINMMIENLNLNRPTIEL